MENGNTHPEDRLWVNCGVVVQGTATEVDKFLKELSGKELKLIYKTVSLGHLWIKQGREGGDRQ